MQVFIVGSPLETARALDPKRLNRQIQETKVILAALNGAKAWSHHPCVLQYRGYEEWLQEYVSCLTYYRDSQKGADKWQMALAKVSSEIADDIRPDWHNEAYYAQNKCRLYTKEPKHYWRWKYYGTSEENWYFVDGSWRKYVNGKRIWHE